jgi:hypothetical protein
MFRCGATLVSLLSAFETPLILIGHSVTKLVLGANVALPGAFLCISRHLELISSKRKIETDLKTTRNRTLLDFLFCYIIPVIYMALRVWFPPLPGVPN